MKYSFIAFERLLASNHLTFSNRSINFLLLFSLSKSKFLANYVFHLLLLLKDIILLLVLLKVSKVSKVEFKSISGFYSFLAKDLE